MRKFMKIMIATLTIAIMTASSITANAITNDLKIDIHDGCCEHKHIDVEIRLIERDNEMRTELEQFATSLSLELIDIKAVDNLLDAEEMFEPMSLGTCPLCRSSLREMWDWWRNEFSFNNHPNCWVVRTYRIVLTSCSWASCSFQPTSSRIFQHEQHIPLARY